MPDPAPSRDTALAALRELLAAVDPVVYTDSSYPRLNRAFDAASEVVAAADAPADTGRQFDDDMSGPRNTHNFPDASHYVMLAPDGRPVDVTAPREPSDEEWLVRWSYGDGGSGYKEFQSEAMARRQAENLLRSPTAIKSARVYRRAVSPWVEVDTPEPEED